ncbi:MAG: DUF1549 domain-containing protein, partial [Planctomycetota bacterium]
MISQFVWVLALILTGCCVTHAFGPPPPATDVDADADAISQSTPVSFSRDVRQLLSDRCFLCHGTDENSRAADLRLDQFDSATESAIVPGDPDASEIIDRITSNDPDLVMPPPESHKTPLTKEEIETLRRWIAEGAKYETHWAFESPKRPTPPEIRVGDSERRKDWSTRAIDRFVLKALDQKQWQPSPRADRRTLLRRASLDLTGLPPTTEQIRRFLEDDSRDAWSNAIDDLLQSDAFGEHQARYWLDAARYADTNGYQYDFQRDQWVWRDWVINAFNTNKPFDQFTIEQLAGDLIPDATPQQRLATGFNRNHPITVEGGIIDEEYRVEYVLDRTTTAGTVWMGMTVGCARCHDHKYDPLTQKEFYQLSAFFNQVPERGMKGFQPSEKITSPLQRQAMDASRQSQRDAERDLLLAFSQISSDTLTSRIDAIGKQLASGWETVAPASVRSLRGADLEVLADGSVLATGKNPAKDVYEITFSAADSAIGALRLVAIPYTPSASVEGDAASTDLPAESGKVGRSSNGNFVLSEIELEAASNEDAAKFQSSKLRNANADFSQSGYDISRAIDGRIDGKGWAIYGPPKNATQQHTATFTLAKKIAKTARVRVRLRFESGSSQHQIARFRLMTRETVGNADAARLRGIVAKRIDQWTGAERLAVAHWMSEGLGDPSLTDPS